MKIKGFTKQEDGTILMQVEHLNLKMQSKGEWNVFLDNKWHPCNKKACNEYDQLMVDYLKRSELVNENAE